MNVLITGASKGIGRAIAQQLADQNYNLILCARNSSSLELVVQEIKQQNSNIQVHGVVVDCERLEEVKYLAQIAIDYFSHIDILVNNVGLYLPGNLLDEQENALERQLQTNLYAAHYLSTFFGKKMRAKKRGHIFNICSIASIYPVVCAGSYSISKFALMGLTKVLREELAPHNVKVTAVLPGATLTNSWLESGQKWDQDLFVASEDIAIAIVCALKMTSGANLDEIIIQPVKKQVDF